MKERVEFYLVEVPTSRPNLGTQTYLTRACGPWRAADEAWWVHLENFEDAAPAEGEEFDIVVVPLRRPDREGATLLRQRDIPLAMYGTQVWDRLSESGFRVRRGGDEISRVWNVTKINAGGSR